MTTFSELQLAAPLLKALEAEGYTTPTPIQQQAIPYVLEGRDLLGIAQTGTGKTAAFALPILHHLLATPDGSKKRSTRVLVLAPTRELAAQIADSFRSYSRFMAVRVTTAFGGVPIQRQIKQIVPGVEVLVATPGRLLDLIDQRILSLSDLEVLVLDEADQMLDLGFIHALRRIVQLVPKDRQTLFFSATMPKSISDLASRYLSNPQKVEVAPAATTAERIAQSAVYVNQGEKQALLTITLRDTDINRVLVFTRTKHGADKVVKALGAADIQAAAIHGNKSQPQRTRALEAFRAGRCKVLVATDIAARGIDIDDVSHVINFDVPNVPEQYVHRIGRTARAGREGLAMSFVANDERVYMRDIERLTGQRIEVLDLPDNFVAQAKQIKALKPAPQPKAEATPAQPGKRRRGNRKPNGKAGDRPASGKPRSKVKQGGKPVNADGGERNAGGKPGNANKSRPPRRRRQA